MSDDVGRLCRRRVRFRNEDKRVPVVFEHTAGQKEVGRVGEHPGVRYRTGLSLHGLDLREVNSRVTIQRTPRLELQPRAFAKTELGVDAAEATAALHELLDSGSIALLPALGYSPTGEVFNLSAADVAGAVAAALGADKLIFLTESKTADGRGRVISSMVPREVDALLARRQRIPEEQARVLHNAATACRAGVHRVHILNRHQDGILLSELFTRDGAGTLVTAEPYELVREAGIDDVGGILELIEPMEASGVLVKRSRELLEQEISQFTVVERDGAVIACAALYPYPDDGLAELACVAVHPDYRGAARGEALLRHIEDRARHLDLGALFVLSTRTSHWFRERGFQTASVERLPQHKRDLYNWRRGAKVFIKSL